MNVSDHSTAGKTQREMRAGVYVVGFFDLLGQSNALKPYIDVRGEPQHIEELRQEMTRVINQLLVFRKDITRYFEAASAVKLTGSAPAGTTAEQLAIAEDYESPAIKIQGFSDTIVIYVPLTTSAGHVSLYGIWPLMFSVVNTMLLSFARGFTVRGAIDASWGTEPFDGEFYGPALLSVYGLETKIANWSRIVLGPGIQRLWQITRHSKAQTPIDTVNVALAQLQSSWAFSDVDKTMAVDYLNPSMLEAVEVPELDLPMVIDAAHVKLEQLFLESSGSDRVQQIIGAALNYFETRRGPLTEERRKRAALLGAEQVSKESP